MKICLIAHLNDLSGANKALVDLAVGLKERHDVTVVVPRKGALSEKLEELGVTTKIIVSGTWVYKRDEPLIKKWAKRILNFFAESVYYRFFKKNAFDLVHYNSITYGCGAQALAKLKTPYVWHIRELAEENFNLTFFNKRKSYELIRGAARVLTISKFMLSKIAQDFDKDKIVVVYDGNAIKDKPSFSPAENYKLVLIGAIAEDKGQLDAIRALEILNNKGVVLDLHIVGAVTDEQYYQSVLKAITPNIENHVHFEGYLRDVGKYRTSEYIALMCSKAEAFGLVTIEAMNSGQLIIGANGGATPELIAPELTGCIYEYGNPVDLANKIEMLLNSEEKEQIVFKAYENVSKKFNIKTTIDNVDRIYHDVITSA